MLDSDIETFFSRHAELDFPWTGNLTPVQMRSKYWIESGLFRETLPPNVSMEDACFESPGRQIRARVFTSRADESSSATIVFFHGGGWVLGDVEGYSPLCARLAQATGARVISIDYPLAPEHSWREITDYCLDAFCAVAERCISNDTNSRLAIVGDSAGAHLASVTAIRARDEHPSYRIVLQALIYPCIDPECSTESFKQYEHGPSLTKVDMQRYWKLFAGDDLALEDLRVSPMRAASLSGLPPAFVITAGCDPLRDDGRRYADNLRNSGVWVEHLDCATLPHGFLGMGSQSEAARRATENIGRRIGELLVGT
jgi:acetyl esterase